ncbi:MAG: hypothetical protein JOZ95_13755 [Solirubrobacterales bacterium]|nr:hypothetical protein [Solirubrobacterales bacterium]
MISKKIVIGFAVTGVLAGAAAIAPGLGAGASADVAGRAHSASPITVIDGNTNPTGAGTAINTYCGPNFENCKFVGPASPTLGYGPPRSIGDAVYNCGQTYAEDKVEISDERSESTSLDQSVSLSVKVGIIKLEGETEFSELEKISSGLGTTGTVEVAPGEKGWLETRVPTASATGYITDGIHFQVTNFELTFPGYRLKGSNNSIIFTSVHDKLGDDQKLCKNLALTLPPAPVALGAGPGLPILICTARRCTTRVMTLAPAIRPNTEVTLARGTRIYATGTAGRLRIVLRARRHVPPGRYVLFLTGPRRTTMRQVTVR